MSEKLAERVIRALPQDYTTTPKSMFDDVLTYFADGTRVARKGHPDIVGTTAGMTTDAIPYQFQVVNWDDARPTNTAPHVLVRVEEVAVV
jgi:hypothetical protein